MSSFPFSIRSLWWFRDVDGWAWCSLQSLHPCTLRLLLHDSISSTPAVPETMLIFQRAAIWVTRFKRLRLHDYIALFLRWNVACTSPNWRCSVARQINFDDFKCSRDLNFIVCGPHQSPSLIINSFTFIRNVSAKDRDVHFRRERDECNARFGDSMI